MTISATELLEPAPNTPSFMAVYGSKVIAVGRNMVPSGGHSLIAPNGTYSVMNTSTNTARLYGGLSGATIDENWIRDSTDRPCAVLTIGDKWIVCQLNGGTKIIDPASPAFISSGPTVPGRGGSYRYSHWLICGEHLVSISADYGITTYSVHIPTSTVRPGMYTGNYGSGAVVVDDTHVAMHTNYSGFRKVWDIVAGAEVADITGPWAATGIGCLHGGYAWTVSGNTFYRLNPTTYASSSYTTTVPGGTPNGSPLVVGPTGMLHTMGVGEAPNPVGSPVLITFDPVTAMVDKSLITPDYGANARRYAVVSAAGKLWIAGGYPYEV